MGGDVYSPLLSEINLSGENCSGLQKFLGSNIIAAKLGTRTAPLGIVYPPISTVSSVLECYKNIFICNRISSFGFSSIKSSFAEEKCRI